MKAVHPAITMTMATALCPAMTVVMNATMSAMKTGPRG